MLSTKTRTTIIALVASAGVAAASVAPAASQAQTVRVVRPVTVIAPVAATGGVHAAISGHTTGEPGAESEKVCEAIGNLATMFANAGTAAEHKGESEEAEGYRELAKNQENEGLDKGCFFIE
jgi:hypothetical protein